MKIREHGLQQRERSRVYPDKPTCASGGNFGSVRWIDCYASVMILGCGGILSLITFGVEIVVKSKLTGTFRNKIRRLNCLSSLINGVAEVL